MTYNYQIKKVTLLAGIVLSCHIVFAQTCTGLPAPTFHWRCATADSLLNRHPATTLPVSFDSIPYAGDYTLIAVYKPVVDTESAVWRLVFEDSIIRGLTTERITSGATSIRYADTTVCAAVIHTLRQTAPTVDDSAVSLIVGDGGIKVAEVLYYGWRLDNAALRRVQSALAIRYGITLGPVDYIGGDGTHVWLHRRDSALFHHRITGIGNDSSSCLLQLHSHSESEGSFVDLTADSLPQGAYLLFGDNDAPLSFLQESGDAEVLARQWQVQSTGMDNAGFSLSFDTRCLPGPIDSLVLVFDNGIVLPSASTANTVCFNGLSLSSDSSIFTLARGSMLWRLAQNGVKNARSGGATDGMAGPMLSDIPSFSVYPNPTPGHFFIEVSGARRVTVTVYSLQGKVMATYNGSDRDSYLFEGSLPAGNSYYAAIVTETGSQTLKLVVK